MESPSKFRVRIIVCRKGGVERGHGSVSSGSIHRQTRSLHARKEHVAPRKRNVARCNISKSPNLLSAIISYYSGGKASKTQIIADKTETVIWLIWSSKTTRSPTRNTCNTGKMNRPFHCFGYQGM